jgi:hypothetical protein
LTPAHDYGPGRPLVFSHIPKTAGTSLSMALQQSLQPSVYVFGLDTSLFGGYDDIDAVRPAMRALIFRDPGELPADATLVVGHISPATTSARYPDADHVTVLRVPQLRHISQWLHGRSVSELSLRHWGTAGDAFRASRLPLRSYLQHRMIAPNVDNTITRFLAWPNPLLAKTDFIDEAHDDELFAAAIDRLDSFKHANVIENAGFMSELGSALGLELPPVKLNERTSVPRRMQPDIAAELAGGTRELLDHRCRIDVRIWEHLVRRVLPDTVPHELLEGSMRAALERYATMLAAPAGRPTLRTSVERLYEIGLRLDPRSRRAPDTFTR